MELIKKHEKSIELLEEVNSMNREEKSWVEDAEDVREIPDDVKSQWLQIAAELRDSRMKREREYRMLMATFSLPDEVIIALETALRMVDDLGAAQDCAGRKKILKVLNRVAIGR